MSELQQVLLDLANDASIKAEQISDEIDNNSEDSEELSTDFYYRCGEAMAYKSIASVLKNLAEQNK